MNSQAIPYQIGKLSEAYERLDNAANKVDQRVRSCEARARLDEAEAKYPSLKEKGIETDPLTGQLTRKGKARLLKTVDIREIAADTGGLGIHKSLSVHIEHMREFSRIEGLVRTSISDITTPIRAAKSSLMAAKLTELIGEDSKEWVLNEIQEIAASAERDELAKLADRIADIQKFLLEINQNFRTAEKE